MYIDRLKRKVTKQIHVQFPCYLNGNNVFYRIYLHMFFPVENLCPKIL
jgi:hypothetical protein